MKKQIPTIRAFVPDQVSWKIIEEKLGKREFTRFQKWMRGQTCGINGVYNYDLERYLEGRRKGIKDPYVWD